MSDSLNRRPGDQDCGDLYRGGRGADMSDVARDIYRPGGLTPPRPFPCNDASLPAISLTDSSAAGGAQQQQEYAGRTRRHGVGQGEGERDGAKEREMASNTRRFGTRSGDGERDAALDRRLG